MKNYEKKLLKYQSTNTSEVFNSLSVLARNPTKTFYLY